VILEDQDVFQQCIRNLSLRMCHCAGNDHFIIHKTPLLVTHACTLLICSVPFIKAAIV